MPLRNTRPIVIRPKGCSDALDGTNAFPGAMMALQNLVPAPHTDQNWVCRPAAQSITNFPGFAYTGPNNPPLWDAVQWGKFVWGASGSGFVSALLVVGDVAYGLIATSRFGGRDEPFAFNLRTAQFLPVQGVQLQNVPANAPLTGDWTPPILAAVGSKVIVTHPGFTGGAGGNRFGFFDVSGFLDATKTGNSHASTLIDNLSANVLQAGFQVGMTIASNNGEIRPGTWIKAIAANGLSLTLSQAASGSFVGSTFTVAGGAAGAPLWGAGDLNLNNLPSVPVGVAQFNGRAYFACGINGIPFSDAGNPMQATNATQVLKPANGVPVTALGALPLGAVTTGGVIQSIIAFQGVARMQQITGDPSTNNLALNDMNVATGTLAPLSICGTNFGLAFISPEGLRVVSQLGVVSDPIGDHGTGISVPFINALVPSRICAAATADTIRISVQNNAVSGQPHQEWWFDIARKVWSGPHTWASSLIQPWTDTFVATPVGTYGSLFRSDAVPSNASSFTELGRPLTFVGQSVLSPAEANESAIVQSEIALSIPPGQSITVTSYNEAGSVLDSVLISAPAAAGPLWGSVQWGGFIWGTVAGFLRRWPMRWRKALVFKQMSLYVAGNSGASFILGDAGMQIQSLGYMEQNAGSNAI